MVVTALDEILPISLCAVFLLANVPAQSLSKEAHWLQITLQGEGHWQATFLTMLKD